MRRSLITLGLALFASSWVMWLAGGWPAVLLSGEIMLPVGVVALLIAHAADAGRLRLSSLRHRFQLSVGLALAQLLAAILVGALVMFVSPEDAKTTIGILVFAGLIAARAAQILLRDVLADVAAVSNGLREVGKGERDARIHTRSSRELVELADSANLMTATLAREERARDDADAARRQVVADVSPVCEDHGSQRPGAVHDGGRPVRVLKTQRGRLRLEHRGGFSRQSRRRDTRGDPP